MLVLKKIIFLKKCFGFFLSKLIVLPWIRIWIKIGPKSWIRIWIQIQCIWIHNTYNSMVFGDACTVPMIPVLAPPPRSLFPGARVVVEECLIPIVRDHYLALTVKIYPLTFLSDVAGACCKSF